MFAAILSRFHCRDIRPSSTTRKHADQDLVTPDRTNEGSGNSRKGRGYSLAAVTAFVCAGFYVAKDAVGVEATIWMCVFLFSDLATPDQVADFAANLLIPVPIALSLLEIAVYKTFGSTYLITHVLYRCSLVFSYVLAIYLCSESRNRLLFCTFASFVFLWCTVLIHPGNPQLYDIIFPFVNLLFIIALKHVRTDDGASESTVASLLLCVLAGFGLSMVELLRPFVFLLMPFLLFCVYQKLKRMPIKYFMCFLVPVLLFSGSWHVYIAARHGQITWSNHSGFNLMRAWPMVERPLLVPEPNDQPLAPGHLANLNTLEHLENSRRLQAGLLRFLVTHPLESLENIVVRLCTFLTVPTKLSLNDPPYPELWLYRVLVWLGCLAVVRNLVVLAYRTVSSRSLDRFGDPANILSCMALAYIILMAVGDAGEESRFWISVLPLLAALLPRVDVQQNRLRLQRAFALVQRKWQRRT